MYRADQELLREQEAWSMLPNSPVVAQALSAENGTCIHSGDFSPVAAQALSAENGTCSRIEGDSLKSTCLESCKSACSSALEKWKQKTKEDSGFALLVTCCALDPIPFARFGC